MMKLMRTATNLTALSIMSLTIAACNNEPAASFSQDVHPILEKHCFQCHLEGGKGTKASGLNMSTYDSLMKGTHYGPMVIAGDVEGSNLLVLVEGRADPSIRMPHGPQEPVAKQDIQTIRSWIEQGAKNN